jgi:hypothetical protein
MASNIPEMVVMIKNTRVIGSRTVLRTMLIAGTLADTAGARVGGGGTMAPAAGGCGGRGGACMRWHDMGCG